MNPEEGEIAVDPEKNVEKSEEVIRVVHKVTIDNFNDYIEDEFWSDALFEGKTHLTKQFSSGLQLGVNKIDQELNGNLLVFVNFRLLENTVSKVKYKLSIFDGDGKCRFEKVECNEVDEIEKYIWKCEVDRKCLEYDDKMVKTSEVTVLCEIIVTPKSDEKSNLNNQESENTNTLKMDCVEDDKNENIRVVEDILNAKPRVTDSLAHKWSFDNFGFFYRDEWTIDQIESNKFHSSSNNEHKFHLSLYPNGDRDEFKYNLSIFLNHFSLDNVDVNVRYKLSIIDQNGEKFNTRGCQHIFRGKQVAGNGIGEYMSVSNFNELLHNDKIILFCEVIGDENGQIEDNATKIVEVSESHFNAIVYILMHFKNNAEESHESPRIYMPIPMQYDLEVTLEEIFAGCTKNVKIVNNVIDQAGLETQEEKFIDVEIEPGAFEGMRITSKGSQGGSRVGEIPGDVVFVVKTKPHKIFKRNRCDLLYTANISHDETFARSQFVIPTLNNDAVPLKMDEIITNDTVKSIPNRGFPHPHHFRRNKNGDLIVRFNIIDSIQTADKDHNMIKLLSIYNFNLRNFITSTSSNTKYPFIYSNTIAQCNRIKMHLELCPNGEDVTRKDFVSIFVIGESSFQNEIQVFGIISILNSDGVQVYTREISQIINKFERFGWPDFIKRDYILNEKNQFLSNGNLQLYCKIFIKSIHKLEELNEFKKYDKVKNIREVSDCKINKITHFSHKWTVENLKIFYEENRDNKFENIISRNFSHNSKNKNKFFLSLFPNGDCEANKNYLTIFFGGTSPIVLDHSLNVRISLLNEENVKCYKFGRKFRRGANELMGWPLIQKYVLLDPFNNLLSEDKLKIYCEIEFIEHASFDIETEGGIHDQQAISTIENNSTFWFSHHWTIHNFDEILNKRFSANIQSTEFSASDKSNMFILKLFKKSTENFENIFILSLINSSNVETDLIKFRCSIIDVEGNEIFSKENENNINSMLLKLNNLNGNKLEILCDIYEEPKLEYFQKLAICDNFNAPWALRTLSDVKLQSGSETKIKTFLCEYKWTLVNFNQIISNSDHTDKSVIHYPDISKSNYDQIQCKIQVFSYDGKNLIFKLYIEYFDTNNPIIEFSISIIDSNGQKCITKDGTQKLSKGVDIEWSEYLQKDFLLSNGLIIDDKLTILAELKGFSEQVTKLLEFPEIEIRNSLHGLKEGQQSDVVFIFESGNMLYAHKNILSSASKEFSSMFRGPKDWINRLMPNNMMRYFPLNLSINEDEIAFEEMLRYLYTGKIQSKNKLYTKLLVLADKYDLENLKTLLKERLIEKINVNLSTSELFELLKLSNSGIHGLDNLKNKCMNIINENIDVIMHSLELDLLDPSLIQELYFNYIELIKSRKK